MAGLAWTALAVVILTRLLARGRGDVPSRRAALGFAAVAAPLGLALRLYGFDRSLWLDELGTRWTVSGGFSDVLARTQAFHGQSAFYYALLWPWRAVAGESAVVLRSPSLGASVAAAWLVGDAARRLTGERSAFWWAAGLAWLSFPFIEAAAQARVYSLALALAALALWGFVRAAGEGSGWGRAGFAVGAAGLFASHYPLAVALGGVAAAYALQPELRRRYRPCAFLFDAGAATATGLVWLPHLAAVWARRGVVAWNPEVDFWATLEGAGPLLVLAAVAAVARRPLEYALERALWAGALAPAVVLGALALAGPNLLERRYAVVAAVPAAILAGCAAARTPLSRAAAGWAFWGGSTGLYLAAACTVSGTFTLAGRQDWRGAVVELEQRLAADPGALVALRSGFVEEDCRVAEGPLCLLDDVFREPLRRAGRPAPRWDVVSLTYRWSAAESWLDEAVAPRLAGRDTAYLLTCRCFTVSTDDYPARWTQWIESRFPGEFRVSEIDAGVGILLLKHERRLPLRSRTVSEDE